MVFLQENNRYRQQSQQKEAPPPGRIGAPRHTGFQDGKGEACVIQLGIDELGPRIRFAQHGSKLSDKIGDGPEVFIASSQIGIVVAGPSDKVEGLRLTGPLIERSPHPQRDNGIVLPMDE